MAWAERPAGRRAGRFSFSGFSGGTAPHRRRHSYLLRRHCVLYHPAVPETLVPSCRRRVHDAAGAVCVPVPAPAPAVDAVRSRAGHSMGRCRAAALPDGERSRRRDTAAGGILAGAGPVPDRLRLGDVGLPGGRSAGRRPAADGGAPSDPRRRGRCRGRCRPGAGSLHRPDGAADRRALRRCRCGCRPAKAGTAACSDGILRRGLRRVPAAGRPGPAAAAVPEHRRGWTVPAAARTSAAPAGAACCQRLPKRSRASGGGDARRRVPGRIRQLFRRRRAAPAGESCRAL